MTTKEQIAGLESRIVALEAALANAPANAGGVNPFPPKNLKARWLPAAKFRTRCATARCSNGVNAGDRAFYVPKGASDALASGTYCAPCAEALGR